MTFVCRNCNASYEDSADSITIYGRHYCPECRGNISVRCGVCGGVHKYSEMMLSAGMLVCASCAGLHFFTCGECGKLMGRAGSRTVEGKRLCLSCLLNYVRCNECGMYLKRNTKNAVRSEDGWYCKKCYSEIEKYEKNDEYVRSYAYKPAPLFSTTSKKDNVVPNNRNLYLGFELEIGGKENSVNSLDPKIVGTFLPNTYCKSDCSIDDGFEIVSHPATLKFHMAAKKRFERCMEILKRRGFEDGNATCGLHVHVNRAFFEGKEDAIPKLIMLMDKHYGDVLRLCGRSEARARQWSARNNSEVKTPAYYREKYGESRQFHCPTRYVAVNLNNTNTVEIRIYRSTMSWKKFAACLQFTDQLARFACSRSWADCVNSTMQDIAGDEYEELTTLMRERGLIAECLTAAA